MVWIRNQTRDCLQAVHRSSVYNEIDELKFVNLFNGTLKAFVRVSLNRLGHGLVAHLIDERHRISHRVGKPARQECPDFY
jgi:hypothetical protein